MIVRFFTVPNVLTICNLLCGTVAVIVAMTSNDLVLAFWLLVLAAAFDFGDGFVAKLLGQYSEMGKQLDSLCDVVSFGLAPSLILFQVMTTSGAGYLSYIALLIVAFSALRLAKFNIDDSQKTEFCGLPVPANALFFASIGYLFAEKGVVLSPIWYSVIAVVMSWFLISPVRMFALKFSSYSILDNKIRYGFVLVTIVGLILFHVSAVPFVVAAYVLLSVIKHVTKVSL